jgi:hypothetical protein
MTPVAMALTYASAPNEIQKRINFVRVLIGASILSAAGSLPLQILPFLVLSLVAGGRIDVAFAGWVGSSFLIGMLSSALLLPLLGVQRLNGWHALTAVCAIGLAIFLSIDTTFLPVFFALWFVVGFSCGGLQFLGATTAAAADNKPQAFALRLSVALIIAGCVIIALAQFDSQKIYTKLAYFLIAAFGLSGLLGLTLYRSIAAPIAQPAAAVQVAKSGQRKWSGLIIVFCFFIGQPGFWAYAMQSASQRGLDLKGAAFVIAAAKIASALILLYKSQKNTSSSGLGGLLALGCAIAISIFAMTYSAAVLLFFVGFLAWELALNILSARLQGSVVAASPSHAGAWITAAIMLGAATGPIIHGAAIKGDIEMIFITYSAISGLLPFLWSSFMARKS